MKYLSVEKRCELILELYQSLYGVLESPILRGRSVESNSMSNTLNRGIIFKTRSETNTTSEKTTKYDYEYKGKLASFSEAVSPYLDKIDDIKAESCECLIVNGYSGLLKNLEKYTPSKVYHLVGDISVLKYDLSANKSVKKLVFDNVYGDEHACKQNITIGGHGVCISPMGVAEVHDDSFVCKEYLVDLFDLFSALTNAGEDVRGFITSRELKIVAPKNIELEARQ